MLIDKIQKFFVRTSDIIEQITKFLLIITSSVMVASIVLQVFSRYILNFSFSWTEELARYLMIWVAFMAGSLAIKYDRNVGVKFIIKLFPQKVKYIILQISRLLILFFLVELFRGGVKLVGFTQFQLSPGMQLPMSYVYLSIPIGAALMGVQLICLIINDIGKLDNIKDDVQ